MSTLLVLVKFQIFYGNCITVAIPSEEMGILKIFIVTVVIPSEETGKIP